MTEIRFPIGHAVGVGDTWKLSEDYFDQPDPRYRLRQATMEFVVRTGIDVEKDTQYEPGWAPMILPQHDGSITSLETTAGANYYFTQLVYLGSGDTSGYRFVAEIPPGQRTEKVYWARAGGEKNLTIHKGRGRVVIVDPLTEREEIIECGAENVPDVVLPRGVFYTLIASEDSTEPLVISGFYPEMPNWGDLETVIQPADTLIRTPDGILLVPEFLRDMR